MTLAQAARATDALDAECEPPGDGASRRLRSLPSVNASTPGHDDRARGNGR